MTNRRCFLCCGLAGVFAGSSRAFAQAPGIVHRLGYLSARSTHADVDDAFVRGMRELGYVVGRNLAWFSLPWSAEVNEYGLYLTAVLIAPWLLRRGHHVSVDIVMQAMPASVARIVVRITDLFLLGICATLCWYGVAAALRSQTT